MAAVAAAGDVMAGTGVGQLEWKAGLGAVIVGVEAEAGNWRGWVGATGGAERWREGAEACVAAVEGG